MELKLLRQRWFLTNYIYWLISKKCPAAALFPSPLSQGAKCSKTPSQASPDWTCQTHILSAPKSQSQEISWSTSFSQSLILCVTMGQFSLLQNMPNDVLLGQKKGGCLGLMAAILSQVVKNESFPRLIDQPTGKGPYETVPNHVPFSWYPLHTQNILNTMNSTYKRIPSRSCPDLSGHLLIFSNVIRGEQWCVWKSSPPDDP